MIFFLNINVLKLLKKHKKKSIQYFLREKKFKSILKKEFKLVIKHRVCSMHF